MYLFIKVIWQPKSVLKADLLDSLGKRGSSQISSSQQIKHNQLIEQRLNWDDETTTKCVDKNSKSTSVRKPAKRKYTRSRSTIAKSKWFSQLLQELILLNPFTTAKHMFTTILRRLSTFGLVRQFVYFHIQGVPQRD